MRLLVLKELVNLKHANLYLVLLEIIRGKWFHITVLSGGEKLPLVPSDLGAPGFEEGKLAADRSEASVTIVQWGIPARRLLERLCEHWSG